MADKDLAGHLISTSLAGNKGTGSIQMGKDLRQMGGNWRLQEDGFSDAVHRFGEMNDHRAAVLPSEVGRPGTKARELWDWGFFLGIDRG